MLFVETRMRQLRKSAKPFAGDGCVGERQLNNDCSLSPLNGVNAWFTSVAKNVAFPVASTIAGAGELPRSQSTVGDQSFVVGSTPSHCST